jgi:nucleoside-diphosphate-sugar epimerase
MSGLTGNGRVFAKYFAGKQVAFSENPVNHVFIHDATEAIVFALKNFKENKIYNVAAPEHPAKREVIEAQIEMHPEYAPAGFDGRKERFKIISSEKIIQEGFKFAYANPRFFI